jgi:hypothetical protein
MKKSGNSPSSRPIHCPLPSRPLTCLPLSGASVFPVGSHDATGIIPVFVSFVLWRKTTGRGAFFFSNEVPFVVRVTVVSRLVFPVRVVDEGDSSTAVHWNYNQQAHVFVARCDGLLVPTHRIAWPQMCLAV